MASLPPGPRYPPLIQTAIWARRAQPFLTACEQRYGDAFTVRLATQPPAVMLSSPEAVRQVFMGDPSILRAGDANRILLPLVGPSSLLLLDGDAHLRQRKLLSPPFHGERMQSYVELMADVAGREIDRWPAGRPYRTRTRMQAITLEIILRAVFGVSDGERKEKLGDELRRLMDLITSPWRTLAIMALGPDRVAASWTAMREMSRTDGPIFAEIADRRLTPDLGEREDILSLLLTARYEDGEGMSDSEIRDELVTLLVAGHETTATSLAWAIERLAQHPEKLDRIAEEARTGDDAYLEAVIRETLRIRPVIPIVARMLSEPTEIDGLELPAGIAVCPCIHLLHRRADLYPEPDRFRPERFLDEAPGTYTWIPFGGGTRRCIGASFAQLEMKVVLRELLRRRSFHATGAAEGVTRRGITDTPQRDAEVILS